MSINQEAAPSQREIAAALGVSVSTVSRALSNAPGISAELRQRVVDIAGELGYGRASRARSAAEPRPQPLRHVALFMTLGIFPGDSAGFYHGILKGAEEEVRESGGSLAAVFVDDRDPELQCAEIARYCRAHPGCGALLVALDRPEFIAAVREAGGAAVLVNGWDPDMEADGVMPANERGAALAAAHLISLGHRRIAIVTSRQRPTLVARCAAFQRALREAGLGEPELIELSHLHPDMAREMLRARLAAGGFTATGILCGNDLVAMGVLSALREHGIAVPQQCSVVGFDDTPIAALSQPRLTTVQVDREAIGRLGARRLLERLADPTLTPLTIQLACRMVVRDSTAPAGQTARK